MSGLLWRVREVAILLVRGVRAVCGAARINARFCAYQEAFFGNIRSALLQPQLAARGCQPPTSGAGRGRPAPVRSRAAVPDNGMVIEVEPARFEEMVAAALDGLPDELGRVMQNVAVTVAHGAGPPGLLGLYQGIPLTSRSSQYAGVLPDRITIYRQAICAICWTPGEVVEQVRRTVVHEVGHHFGIADDRLEELGW